MGRDRNDDVNCDCESVMRKNVMETGDIGGTKVGLSRHFF